ncbi:uncharacterized protein LOC130720470 [Lotus japonicus]|uniref:uncharacterized protein LOC130720470 n=1 Tax=Lotus japonicus TaxID=34305 RepID=UPI0025850155|nr:uncharacterized protein LOC130720470 [Lotus japonicus]XP_057427182.1 uncharacterized protein LOC130720470 [Lotus japonicus]XP_057427243.1 uncharacterized protein LOC130720470 [Lotus japonicus]XP_057427315.1 uncharacterized protein LOC130720470 [Lotus japonicus]XP_057427376.1 uncharacterized protein LOC130720470 [Lotus japonicus]XP_057427447.1 uncharacterized protein LOC130720470 [Lotus japonicus]XP_057427511.1 uncharacterized protein LOC130720470 [Lotus japonicus]
MVMAPSSDTNATVIFEESTSKYLVLLNGLTIETTVTNKAIVAQEWVHQVSSTHVAGSQMLVGLDTEWMPADKRKDMKTAILQLCVEDKCLIFQLHHMDYIPMSLRSFMTHPEFKFVGVGVKQDIQKLEMDHWLECNGGIDVARLATKQWPGRYKSLPGLKCLAKELVGLDMKKSKDVCLSKWESKELTKAQVEYACVDAYASYKIGKKLLIDGGHDDLPF